MKEDDKNKKRQDFVSGLMDHYDRHSPNAVKNIKSDPEIRKSTSKKGNHDVPTLVTKTGWIISSYGFLLVMLSLVIYFSHQKLFDLDHGVTIGEFNSEYSSFDYSIDGEDYSKFIEIGQGTPTTKYNNTKGKNSSAGKPFGYQFINYEKDNPEKVYFMLGGISNGRKDYTILSNWAVIVLITLTVLNYFFIKFAYRKAGKKLNRR